FGASLAAKVVHSYPSGSCGNHRADTPRLGREVKPHSQLPAPGFSAASTKTLQIGRFAQNMGT
ncbi:MAG: hypothetical protein KUG69_11135, partial [Marinosulfonomonas sp.]|nr:hypothetical protein [Marinosulfonomonas sp.]